MQSLHKHFTTLALATFVAISGIACSGGSDPINPNPVEAITPSTSSDSLIGDENIQNGAQVWGYYELNFDFENETVNTTVSRSANFTSNVTGLLDPADLQVHIKDFAPSADYTDVTVDITITHPYDIQGLQGYDVRGILMGEGSSNFQHNSELSYPAPGTDQVVLNADGYTRWFNAEEFDTPGLFGYTQAPHTNPAYTPTASINPYKYFSDGLNATDDAWESLTETGDSTGIFSAGSSRTREYVIRFPQPGPGFSCGFAITANWNGKDPQDHPAHSTEAPVISVGVTDDIWYCEDFEFFKGQLIMDIGVVSWGNAPSDIIIESAMFNSPYSLADNGQLVPVETGANYFVFHVELDPDDISSLDDQTVWVIAEYDGHDYSNNFGVANDADTDTLSSYVRQDIPISNMSLTGPDDTVVLDPQPVADDVYIDYVFDDTFGMAGNYAFGDNYQVIRYPSDFSSPGEVYMTLEGNWGLSISELLGQPNELAQIAVNVNGAIMISTNATGTFMGTFPQDQCVFWFAPNNPVVQNVLMMNQDIGTAYPVEIIADPFMNGTIRCFYRVPYDNPNDALDIEVTIAELFYPYGPDDWAHHVDCGPLDESIAGDIGGEISANTLEGVSINFFPDNLPAPYDMLVNYVERNPNGWDLEVFGYETGHLQNVLIQQKKPLYENTNAALYTLQATSPECPKHGILAILQHNFGFSYQFWVEGMPVANGSVGGNAVAAKRHKWTGEYLYVYYRTGDGIFTAEQDTVPCY